ncbi:Actin-like protein ARP9 [Cyberlindnera fabianii]|uniref:Actin-like protein ARP9 n=1 Tax=Cyberlindnera fabianii TaxID=36022 RepID=A0A1V2L461_CYBFA|nr:Actin-like protein ARP9 [Cyberlindnera fabianii]
MAPFHEDNYFVMPTKVYPHATLPNAFASTSTDESTAIYPIQGGKIINIDAFNFFIKLIYKGYLKTRPFASNTPLVMISSSRWTKLQIETITQYMFESVGIQAFTIIPAALAAVYAYGGQQNAVVIDIGKENTEIVPVVDYSVVKSATKVIPFGGDSINESLQKMLPNWTLDQIESLKKSDVFEVLSDEDKKKSFFGMDALEAEGDNFDVAEIVTSGRTREILEEREKHNEQKAPNAQLENNTFTDVDGNQITIGKERFKGCELLISKISTAVFSTLEKIVDLTKRQEAWDHVIIIGRTSRIAGFIEALNTQIIEDHLVGKDLQQSVAQAAFQTSSASHIQFSQTPNSIRFAKMPEYFPEWKKTGYADVSFLGAQIVAKQIFSSHNESMYVSKQAYNERGPLAFWDLAF